VLDPFGRLVLEMFTGPNGGSTWLGDGYNGCGAFDFGLGIHVCPKDVWPFD